MWRLMHYLKQRVHLSAGSARSRRSTDSHPTSPSGHNSQGAARLDVVTLGATVQRILQAGLGPATQGVYLAGKKKY